MSKLTSVADNRTVHEKAVADIKSVMGQMGGTINSSDLAMKTIGLESLGNEPLNEMKGTFAEIRTQLLATPNFGPMISALPKHQQDIALEAAAINIMAAGDVVAWHTAAKAPDATGATVVNPNQGMLDYASEYGLEGFDPASLNTYLPQSVYVNTLASIQGGYEETWFPIQVVPAGTTGVDVSVSVPKIFAAVQRNQNGTVSQFSKTSIIKALVNSALLQNNSTKIVPVADNDVAAPNNKLALASAVSTVSETLDGVAVDTRPILFGQKIDVLGISTTAAMLQGGVLDETDALDSVMNVGKLFFTATINSVSLNVAFDVSRQPGSLLQKSAEGSDRLYQTSFTASVVLSRDSLVSVNGGSVPALEAEFDAAGISKIIGTVEISANGHTEEGFFQAFANNPVWKAAYNADGAVVSIPAGSSITMLAYRPQLRRTNSNIRLRGTIIDSQVTTNYRFAVPLSSPIVSQAPVGAAMNTSIEGLANAERIRNNNNAVLALLGLEEVLAANNGLPVNSPLIGSELVNPTYVKERLDLDGIVVRMASKDSLDDLRGAFQAAIMTVVHKLLQQSEYLAALEFVTGSNNGYEVIVVTDSRIYPWLMESGESRTLGNNTQYKITQCLNENMENRIYVSFRRSNRDGQLHPLDFGGFLYTPALTHQVQVTRGGRISQEIQTIPRNAHYVTLPILGRIDVENMVELFVSEPV